MTTLLRLPQHAALARVSCRVVAGLAALALSGCRSLPLQPPIDLSGPGWILREGQAVWRPRGGAEGVAGDLVVATHPDGRSVVQFTKTPLPFIVAQRTTNAWQLQLVPRNKTYSGRGEPPARLFWLHLPDALAHRNDFAIFSFATNAVGGWRFERCATAASLEGYLELRSRPSTHVVRSRDNLLGIARMYGVTIEALNAVNPGAWQTWLRVGKTIHLPPLAPTP